MTEVYIGLGANLGDAAQQLKSAIAALGALPQTRLLRASSLYRTAPVGYLDQPDFINAVAQIETELAPHALLAHLRDIEQRYGRVRSFKDAPRTLDLDMLLYGAQRIDDETLSVPHPRMHQRAFVLAPLTEIAPDCEIPGQGLARDCLAQCADQTISRI